MWCKEEKTGDPSPESHFSPGQTCEIHSPAEQQNNCTRHEQPDLMHSRTIGRFLCFPQDYHRGKSACHYSQNDCRWEEKRKGKRDAQNKTPQTQVRVLGAC